MRCITLKWRVSKNDQIQLTHFFITFAKLNGINTLSDIINLKSVN